MTIKQKYQFLVQYFSEHNPNAASELEFNNPFELIVAVVLSAQCTDKRVNIVTKELFAHYPTPKAMAQAEVSEIYELIKSVSYPNNKAAHLSGLAKMLVSDFGGEVPSTMEELTKLPGVGRKTANLTVAVGFNLPAICVDVHVHRITNRLGLIKTKTPLETEMTLRKILPVRYWKTWNSHLVSFGQTRCFPRNPNCSDCPLRRFCPSVK